MGKENHRVSWERLHPLVVATSKKLFVDGHFAQSVFEAMKAVNNRVKQYYKKKMGQEFDGADLMNKAFSPKQPVIILGDLSTESGQNMQLGYMQIFSGAMSGIRNPKAHDSIKIDEMRALHFLYLASLLMFKLDEAKVEN